MASFLGKLLFSSAIFFFFLAFIFAISGYFTPWLVPQENYSDGTKQVDSVGLKQACFTNFQFSFAHDPRSREWFGKDGTTCYDNSRESAAFTNIAVDTWSPRWFQIIQDMHLSCVILMVFNLLLIGGFLAIYMLASHRKKKRKRQTPCLVISKCGLGLWFIITLIIGILLFVEPLIFFSNYQGETTQFYYSEFHTYHYGPGFGLTIGAGICLLLSGGIGAALFCGMIRSLFKHGLNPDSPRDPSYYSQDSRSQHSLSEMDQLSDHRRKEPEGLDESEIIENYHTEPPKPADRKSIASLHYQDSVSDKEKESRPVPAPRRSVSSRDPSVTPSQDTGRYSEYEHNTPQYTDLAMDQRQGDHPQERPHYAPSVASSARSPTKPMMYDYKPGYGYVPKSARPPSEADMSSAHQANPRMSRGSTSTYTPPTGGAHLYVPPSRASHGGSMTGYSDTESYASDRNRSVSRSAVDRSPQPDNVAQQKVVKPKSSGDAKHSRYAAAGW